MVLFSLQASSTSSSSSAHLGQLFVGQQDGTLSIFQPKSIMPTAGYVQSVLSLNHGPKVLLLSAIPHPCTCMQLSGNHNSVIVGCGNRLTFIAIKELLVEEGAISVSDKDDDVIGGIDVHDDDVWCYIRGSSMIRCYSTQTRQLVTMVQTNLSIPQRYSSASTVAELAAGSSSEVCDLSSQSNTSTTKVTSILVVNDALWVGRNDGLVVVISLVHIRSCFAVGQIIAVLSDGPVTNQLPHSGPISYLARAGSDHVVAYRDATGKKAGQILVWESWGAARLQYFENLLSSLPDV